MPSSMTAAEQAAVLALVRATHRLGRPWHATSDLIETAGSAVAILDGEVDRLDIFEQETADALRPSVEAGDVRECEELIAALRDDGVKLTTVLDDAYPSNLREVYDRPPFLWIRGELRSGDERSIAVVGTRQASETGLRTARELAGGLADRGFTVLSGLARGIDTAAHEATLEAGGRTIAVLGAGINQPIYPAENAGLAEQITGQGAVVSQFWPEAPPTRKTFPMRNAVMSGLALGTLVVEASHTSGARMQARMALEHSKRLFLVRSLVEERDWTHRFVDHPATTVVESAADVVAVLDEDVEARSIEQLTIGSRPVP